jgi:hypothetical protein
LTGAGRIRDILPQEIFRMAEDEQQATGKSRKGTSTRTKGGSGRKADNPRPQTTALDELLRKMRALGTKGKRGTVYENLNESHERK